MQATLTQANTLVEQLTSEAVAVNPYKSTYIINYKGNRITVSRMDNGEYKAYHNMVNDVKRHTFKLKQL